MNTKKVHNIWRRQNTQQPLQEKKRKLRNIYVRPSKNGHKERKSTLITYFFLQGQCVWQF
jgi:hypothetical protein